MQSLDQRIEVRHNAKRIEFFFDPAHYGVQSLDVHAFQPTISDNVPEFHGSNGVAVDAAPSWETELVGADLAALDNTNLPAGRLDTLTETARGYLFASESEATRRSYASESLRTLRLDRMGQRLKRNRWVAVGIVGLISVLAACGNSDRVVNGYTIKAGADLPDAPVARLTES